VAVERSTIAEHRLGSPGRRTASSVRVEPGRGKHHVRKTGLITAFLLILTACQGRSAPIVEPTPGWQPVIAVARTPTPRPGSPPALVGTPDPLFIESLRRYRSEPPPTIEIQFTLAHNTRFTRYAIAYLSDGLRITGVMNVPSNDDKQSAAGRSRSSTDAVSPSPVVLLNHGHFDPSRYHPGTGTQPEADYLATHGYVTIASDYRGYADSEGEIAGHFDPGWTHDILNLFDALPSLAFVDPERVGVWGHSTGGEIALQLIVARTGVDAAVLFGSMGADAADNLGLVQAEGDEWDDRAVRRFGLPAEAPDVWRKISPVAYLDEVTTPISIHHGDLDEEVPPALSAKLWLAMQGAGVPGEYFVYPHQGHFFAGQAWELAMERTLSFFDGHVR